MLKTALNTVLALGALGGLFYVLLSFPQQAVPAPKSDNSSPAPTRLETLPTAAAAVSPSVGAEAKNKFDVCIADLKRALQAHDEPAKSHALQKIKDIISRTPSGTEQLIGLIKAESDGELIETLCQTLLDTGTSAEKKLVTDTALNILLSDDLPARREASLKILAHASDLTSSLVLAVGRTSREDSSTLIKNGAVDALAVWLAQQPDWQSQVSEELRATMASSDDPEVRRHATEVLSRETHGRAVTVAPAN